MFRNLVLGLRYTVPMAIGLAMVVFSIPYIGDWLMLVVIGAVLLGVFIMLSDLVGDVIAESRRKR
jgi:hypothetical protein